MTDTKGIKPDTLYTLNDSELNKSYPVRTHTCLTTWPKVWVTSGYVEFGGSPNVRNRRRLWRDHPDRWRLVDAAHLTEAK